MNFNLIFLFVRFLNLLYFYPVIVGEYLKIICFRCIDVLVLLIFEL
jgi:hypothetical protein